MAKVPEPIRVLTWADFDDFWRELEASHEETPYIFDAYDEKVARIAFKEGRSSMRRQVAAMLERMLALRSHSLHPVSVPSEDALLSACRELVAALVDDVDELAWREAN